MVSAKEPSKKLDPANHNHKWFNRPNGPRDPIKACHCGAVEVDGQVVLPKKPPAPKSDKFTRSRRAPDPLYDLETDS